MNEITVGNIKACDKESEDYSGINIDINIGGGKTIPAATVEKYPDGSIHVHVYADPKNDSPTYSAVIPIRNSIVDGVFERIEELNNEGRLCTPELGLDYETGMLTIGSYNPICGVTEFIENYCRIGEIDLGLLKDKLIESNIFYVF